MARMMEMLPEDDMPVLPADGGTARADLYGCGRPDSIILSEREALIMLHRGGQGLWVSLGSRYHNVEVVGTLAAMAMCTGV